jgi:uncharacterized phage infection (PIP) family protein YhgE
MIGEGGAVMSEEMKQKLSGLETKVDALIMDVDVLKTDVGVLKTDVGVLKTDMGTVKSDVIDLKAITRNIAVLTAQVIGDMAEMKRNMATRDDISMLVKRMDGFVDILQDSRWDWGKQKVRLDDHEKRISVLEAKRA